MYDLTSHYDPNSIWVSQHALSINGKRDNHSKEDLLSIAKSMNIKYAKHIVDDINSVVQNWKKFVDKVSVDPKKRDAIAKTYIKI